jgi:hypothetical protein
MKDLFMHVFQDLSCLEFQAYESEFVSRLPFLMLDAVVQRTPNGAVTATFRELHEYLGVEGQRYWNNPELYPHLLRMQNGDLSTFPGHIHSLRTHVGLDAPDRSSFGGARFLRISLPKARVLELRDGEIWELSGVISEENTAPRRPVIYRPHPHLFDDIAAELYVGDDARSDPAELGRLFNAAMTELRRYCPQLATSFCRTVGGIGFTAGKFEGSARSYSSLFYLGGIFSAITDNVPALVENFIHEYYHCRLWAWWLIEPPRDLPPREVTMVSPVTQAERPVVVMMHALLIYAGLIGYYQFVVYGGDPSYDDRVLAAARARLDALERGTQALVSKLNDELWDRPESRRFVSLITGMVPGSGRGAAVVRPAG